MNELANKTDKPNLTILKLVCNFKLKRHFPVFCAARIHHTVLT
jgi:hypothetical protein